MSARQRKTINVEIGTRIKERRKARGLTRESLSELTGYSVSFIQEIERGRSGLSSESMKRISAALDVSADFLLNGVSAPEALTDGIAKKLESLDFEKLLYLERMIDIFIESHADTQEKQSDK